MINMNYTFDYIYSQDDTISLIYYTGRGSTVAIPASNDGVYVRNIESSCFNSNSDIVRVSIAEGVESIQ